MPECEAVEGESSYITEWLNFSTPFEKSNLPAKCERFASIDSENCTIDSFDRSTSLTCSEFIYEDDEVTILNEVLSANFR